MIRTTKTSKIRTAMNTSAKYDNKSLCIAAGNVGNKACCAFMVCRSCTFGESNYSGIQCVSASLAERTFKTTETIMKALPASPLQGVAGRAFSVSMPCHNRWQECRQFYIISTIKTIPL